MDVRGVGFEDGIRMELVQDHSKDVLFTNIFK
jgi:hypothetical protein